MRAIEVDAMNPQGKTALITGGAHRVGKAITLELARAGANVVINYNRSAEAAQATAAEVQQIDREALVVQADVADLSAVQAMVAAAKEKFGGIDILVNSASLFQKTPVPTDDYSAWHRVTNILLNGSFYCANTVAPLMLEGGAGVIINIVDLTAWLPAPGFTAHSVGKAGLLALTKQLALELAPAVRVNAIAPGPVLPPPDYDDSQNEKIADRTSLQRWGSAEDVAEAVHFLIKADYITGEFITVDGGERYGYRKNL